MIFCALQKGDDEEVEPDFDMLFSFASDIRAHILLTMRNVITEDWDLPRLCRFLSLFTFLNSRHHFNWMTLTVRRCILCLCLGFV
jgi:hypothetical protein